MVFPVCRLVRLQITSLSFSRVPLVNQSLLVYGRSVLGLLVSYETFASSLSVKPFLHFVSSREFLLFQRSLCFMGSLFFNFVYLAFPALRLADSVFVRLRSFVLTYCLVSGAFDLGVSFSARTFGGFRSSSNSFANLAYTLYWQIAWSPANCSSRLLLAISRSFRLFQLAALSRPNHSSLFIEHVESRCRYRRPKNKRGGRVERIIAWFGRDYRRRFLYLRWLNRPCLASCTWLS